MEYPQHYTGIVNVYDLGKGVFPTTYKVTKAIRRSQNEIGFDLQSEDGTRLSFTLKSLDGNCFSGQSGEVTISRAYVGIREEEESALMAGKWKEPQREECPWDAKLSLS